MEDKLQSTIEKIVQLSKQNAEFNLELRKRLDMSSANCVPIDDDRIDQIYEYCIEKLFANRHKSFIKISQLKKSSRDLLTTSAGWKHLDEKTISVIFACHYINKWNGLQTSYAQTRI